MARTLMDNGNRLKLGFFAPNCQGGLAITTAPERWDASWENNLALARMADEAGLDFILPIARWRGWGGPSQFNREYRRVYGLPPAQDAARLRVSMGSA